MNIDTMRWIDRRIGTPLCAIASLLLRIVGLFRPGNAGRPRRVLFIELSEMGTTILAAPAMRKARETLGAELFFVIFKKNVGSLELLQTFPAANVFTIRDDSLLHLALDSLSFLIWTRRKRIDTAIDLELFSRFTALLTGLCGAQRRVGFYRFHNEGLYRGEMLTHRVSYNPHIHIALNLLSLVNALIVGEKQTPYAKTLVEDEDLTVALPKPSPGQLQEMAGKLQAFIGRAPGDGPILLVNPNASELLPHRSWMPERYAELIRRVLAHDERCAVVITGSPSEAPEAAQLAQQGGARCYSLAGQTELAELPALYAQSTAMVTNDSGPSHFAAASGLPTIVLFGPETPKLYQPLGTSQAIYAGLACSPCVSASNHRKTACDNNVCMQAIGVELVFREVAAVLGRRVADMDARDISLAPQSHHDTRTQIG